MIWVLVAMLFFVYHASPNADVTFTAGYLTWSGKDSSDVTFSSIPVMVGGKYLFGKGKFLPYINGELGAHFVTFDMPELNSSVKLMADPLQKHILDGVLVQDSYIKLEII